MVLAYIQTYIIWGLNGNEKNTIKTKFLKKPDTHTSMEQNREPKNKPTLL